MKCMNVQMLWQVSEFAESIGVNKRKSEGSSIFIIEIITTAVSKAEMSEVFCFGLEIAI